MRYRIVCLPNFILPILVLAAAAEETPRQRFEYAQLHMGVRTRLVVYAVEEHTAVTAGCAAFACFADIEQAASDYRPSSELRRLCAQAGGPPVPVSPHLFSLLQGSIHLAVLSDGALDITVGPYVGLWRDARRSGRLPTPEHLAAARPLVGWRQIALDEAARTVRLGRAGMRLDLGAVAKGYACSRAVAVLREHGVTQALVEAGGDLAVSGAPPDSAGWQIAMAVGPAGEAVVRSLTHAAVATSGDTVQAVVIDGRRWSHVVDPRTGLGLTARCQATVIHADGLWSDGLATAACVLGVEAGERLLRTVPGAAGWVWTRRD